MSEQSAENAALYRLFDQAFNAAGSNKGRKRASRDYLIVREALRATVIPPTGGEVRRVDVPRSAITGRFTPPE